MVAREGIEPPTRGFSELGETNLAQPPLVQVLELPHFTSSAGRGESAPVGAGWARFGLGSGRGSRRGSLLIQGFGLSRSSMPFNFAAGSP
jgi:hypothetical protein